MQNDLNKIDKKAVNGLLGINNSLSYKVHEIERHFHSYPRWFEVAATPAGETNIADRLGSGAGTSFQVIAGNDTWGDWVQILGSADTPAEAGCVKFNLHQILVTSTNSAELFYVQIAFGATGDAALTAGTYSEFPILTTNPLGKSLEFPMQSRRHDATTKVWARTKAEGADAKTIDFIFGLHEYEG